MRCDESLKVLAQGGHRALFGFFPCLGSALGGLPSKDSSVAPSCKCRDISQNLQAIAAFYAQAFCVAGARSLW